MVCLAEPTRQIRDNVTGTATARAKMEAAAAESGAVGRERATAGRPHGLSGLHPQHLHPFQDIDIGARHLQHRVVLENLRGFRVGFSLNH